MAVWYSFLSFWQAQALSESKAQAGPVGTQYDVHCNMERQPEAAPQGGSKHLHTLAHLHIPPTNLIHSHIPPTWLNTTISIASIIPAQEPKKNVGEVKG